MKPQGLEALPIGVRRQIAARCATTTPYREITEWLRRDHGVKTSRTALGDFYQRWNRRIADTLPATMPQDDGSLQAATGFLNRACEIIGGVDATAGLELRAASFNAVAKCAAKEAAK